MYEGATARPAHKAIIGLAGILGPSGMLAYLTYMAERLEQMHRMLKPTGSIYLHCDPTASHYLKILMDGISGHPIFRTRSFGSARLVTTERSDGGRSTILSYSMQAKAFLGIACCNRWGTHMWKSTIDTVTSTGGTRIRLLPVRGIAPVIPEDRGTV